VYWSAGDARSNDQSFGLDEFPYIFSEEMQPANTRILTLFNDGDELLALADCLSPQSCMDR
jgi:hypothetical protein